MTSQEDGLGGIAQKPLPRDQFYTTSISQEDPKIWRGRSGDCCKNVGERQKKGIVVGWWWVRICQKADLSVLSAETAFLILSVTHYSQHGYSDSGGVCQKCHCSRLSLYPMIFSKRRSFLGPKNVTVGDCHCNRCHFNRSYLLCVWANIQVPA